MKAGVTIFLPVFLAPGFVFISAMIHAHIKYYPIFYEADNLQQAFHDDQGNDRRHQEITNMPGVPGAALKQNDYAPKNQYGIQDEERGAQVKVQAAILGDVTSNHPGIAYHADNNQAPRENRDWKEFPHYLRDPDLLIYPNISNIYAISHLFLGNNQVKSFANTAFPAGLLQIKFFILTKIFGQIKENPHSWGRAPGISRIPQIFWPAALPGSMGLGFLSSI